MDDGERPRGNGATFVDRMGLGPDSILIELIVDAEDCDSYSDCLG